MSKNYQYYTDLVLKQKNIILTGAPGTGKTTLAKKIAERITGDYKSLLKKRIEKLPYKDKIMQEAKAQLDEFRMKFPKEKLSAMTIDEYCIGNQENNTFCWWLERGLAMSGHYSPGSAYSYILYKNKDTKEIMINKNNEMNKNTHEHMAFLADCIQKLVDTQDVIMPDGAKLRDSLILRILYSYYPNNYFPVYSFNELNKICQELELPQTPKTAIEANNALVKYFKEDNYFKEIDTNIIAHAIYHEKNNKEIEQATNIQENIAFVQFHPSYDYTDFIEGLRPYRNKETKEIGFELKNGIFKEFCIQAFNSPEENFVFIIDEINRAEISKVFGELFFSIDPNYRGKEGKVKLQYSNLYAENSDIPFFNDFYIPENVYIIATMNDIDRSIEPFDFAIKRRFAWHEICPNDTIEEMWQDMAWKGIATSKMQALNNEIENRFSSSYQIGGAYFLKLNELDNNFEKLWDYHLKPLLQDYLKGQSDAKRTLEKFKSAYDDPSLSQNHY